MARQTGPNPFIGRRGILLGYRMAGKYYARVISSLTAERVLNDPAFKQTMQYAGLLGKASRIASAIYRLLPEREHGFYRELTGMAMRLLKQGRTGEEAFEQLYNDHLRPLVSVEAPRQEQVANGRPSVSFIHSRMEVSQQGQVSGNAFADELLGLIFSKPPEEREKEKTSVGGHSLSRPLQEILSEAA